MGPQWTSELVGHLWTEPKPGGTDDENEDAAVVRALDRGEVLLSVADGASTTVYARAWARALIDAARPEWLDLDDAELDDDLDDVRATFAPTPDGPMPWYVTRKATTEGSQAALLVALLRPQRGRVEIRAVAVGDCTLVVLQQDGSFDAFPMSTAREFTSVPALVSSRPQKRLAYQRWRASLAPGEILLACTDAVAAWALACLEAGRRDALAGVLLDLAGSVGQAPSAAGEHGPLRRAMADSGFEHPIRDDDLTLLLCQPVPPAGPKSVSPPSRRSSGVLDALVRRRNGP